MRIVRLLGALLPAAFAALAPAGADAQSPDTRPIRILLAFADDVSYTLAHLIGESIGNAAGRPVIVERKPGATGRLAGEALKNAAPDGATLLFVPPVVPVLNPLVFSNLTYDPARDFAPVTQVGTFRYALAVGPDHPARTGPEFVAWARTQSTPVTFGTAGTGSIPHFFGVLIGQATRVEMVHVPYKGSAPMANDLMGGHIVSGIDSLGNLIERHRAGRIRILATSGNERSPLSPTVPTFREQGLESIEGVGWVAVYARAGTPKAIIDAYSKAIANAVRTPELGERLLKLGVEPTGSTPEELAAIMAADTARWAPIVKAVGLGGE